MKIGHAYDSFLEGVQPALQSKLEEFRLLGYDTITERELWGFLTKKKWKKIKEEIHLYEVVQEILAVRVSDYINYATIQAYKEKDFSFDDQEEWKELLK